jgi:hypothetical protein
MKTSFVLGLAAVVFAGVCGMLMVGCETGDSTVALTVTPSQVTLTSTNSTVWFTVGNTTTGTNTVTTSDLRDLSLPIEWRVSNPGLGVIVATDGRSAIYTRTPAGGVNIVTAKDQYGAEGLATVTQL